MGTFFVGAKLAAPDSPERRQPIELLVDSGSTYTRVGAALFRALSVAPTERRRVVTIGHTVCLFGEAGDLDVLGAYTLEGFGLVVDPVQRKLIPALQYGAATA